MRIWCPCTQALNKKGADSKVVLTGKALVVVQLRIELFIQKELLLRTDFPGGLEQG